MDKNPENQDKIAAKYLALGADAVVAEVSQILQDVNRGNLTPAESPGKERRESNNISVSLKIKAHFFRGVFG